MQLSTRSNNFKYGGMTHVANNIPLEEMCKKATATKRIHNQKEMSTICYVSWKEIKYMCEESGPKMKRF